MKTGPSMTLQGLLNVSNFIALDSYEARLGDANASFDGLGKLVDLLDHPNTENDDPIYNGASYRIPLDLYLTIASYCKKVMVTSKLEITLTDVFMLWEIRLSTLLMAAGIKDSHGNSPVPNSKYLRGEVGMLLKEITKLADLGESTNPSGDDKLPDEVSWSFRNLISRIRYGNSMLLLNFYYAEIFQARSQIASNEDVELATAHIGSLLFSICGFLAAGREYLSIFNQLQQAIPCVGTDIKGKLYTIGSIAGLVLSQGRDAKSPYYETALEMFNDCDQTELLRVLTMVPATNETSVLKIGPDPLSIGLFSGYVTDGHISPRIIYSVCALDELTHLEKFEPEMKTEQDSVAAEQNSNLGRSLYTVYKHWPAQIANYYALE